MGTLYLVHIDPPYYHARHYLGFVDGGADQVASRLARHRSGDGSKLLRAAALAGSDLVVTRVWTDSSRWDERRFKRRKYGPRLCPTCRRLFGTRGRPSPSTSTTVAPAPVRASRRNHSKPVYR